MHYTINDTSFYHIHELESLGWELTVCNSLEPENSPCRKFLAANTTFGNLLYRYLGGFVEFGRVNRIIEIGGGYGYLMRDFLKCRPALKAAMLDISPSMLKKQKETLRDFAVDFIQGDFFACDAGFFRKFDMAVLNENLGDFPAVCGVDPVLMNCPDGDPDEVPGTLRRLMEKYSLPVPGERFNFNIGAVEAVEMLCGAGVPCIYCGEHSCEADMHGRDIHAGGIPEKIILKGHVEYTIKFSHLESVARAFGYSVKRGRFRDFIALDESAELNFIMTSGSQKEGHEAVRQFVEDLNKYEYLLLIRGK